MNLMLFAPGERDRPLPATDRRVIHLRDILHLSEGDTFDAGELDGSPGTGTVLSLGPEGLRWRFEPGGTSPPVHPLTFVIGCPRPPVTRRLLRDLTALGAARLLFCATDLNEKSYLSARLWRTDDWRNALIEGAEQGKSTRLPVTERHWSVLAAVRTLPADADRLYLCGDVDAPSLAVVPIRKPLVLAIGPERGWTDRERALLEDRGFRPAGLGERVLRTETACAAAGAVALGRLGCWDRSSG